LGLIRWCGWALTMLNTDSGFKLNTFFWIFPESVFKLPESRLTHCLSNQTILSAFYGKNMSAKRTAMRKLREVLRLSYSAGLSIRKISASTKISIGSIQNILKLAVQLKITWPLPEDWDDQTLALKFYPRSDAQPSAKFQDPIWTDVHMELKKKGLTKQLLWEEYTQQFQNRCYSYSQFCARYADWRKKTKTIDAADPSCR